MRKQVALYCLMALCVCASEFCNTVEPVINTVDELHVTSNLMLGTEGNTAKEYTFTANHSLTTLPIRYDWNFDEDTTTTSLKTSTSVTHTFAKPGLYNVTVRMVNYEKGTVVKEAGLLINIRDVIPVIDMAVVTGGTFSMGSTVTENESPVHQVSISRKLLVSRYEVTQAQWNAIMGASPSWHQDSSFPVENITWFQAVDYCNRLSIRSGYTPCYSIKGDTVQCLFSASGYRLPTEAEWEYFARAGVTTDYYGGPVEQIRASCMDTDTLDSDLDVIGWYCLNSDMSVHKGGLKRPNAFGLYDVTGNVAEWCWDYYDNTSYKQSSGTNPTGVAVGTERVIRGGSFLDGAFNQRLPRRLQNQPHHSVYNVGFRIVRTLP
ncbi:MAG: formylglycine-generating enzyme family protein [Bacteriodetes bacterium]|nr:formylglycine-generating enzyme family protein [Bacteroidota bacterium]